jgi:hypothetical protein
MMVSSSSRVSASSFKFPSATGISFIRDIVHLHVAGEDCWFRFSFIKTFVDTAQFFTLYDRQSRGRCGWGEAERMRMGRGGGDRVGGGYNQMERSISGGTYSPCRVVEESLRVQKASSLLSASTYAIIVN